jgi:hypothetical protein
MDEIESRVGIEKARLEITKIKPRYIETRGWSLSIRENEGMLDLLVGMRHNHHPERRYVLRLRFTNEFPKRRPEEAFLNPDEPHQEGVEFWPKDKDCGLSGMAFHTDRNPPRICIPGTYGFHAEIHPNERDPEKTSIQVTLLQIQGRIDAIP